MFILHAQYKLEIIKTQEGLKNAQLPEMFVSLINRYYVHIIYKSAFLCMSIRVNGGESQQPIMGWDPLHISIGHKTMWSLTNSTETDGGYAGEKSGGGVQ